jgi:hypothetical protein
VQHETEPNTWFETKSAGLVKDDDVMASRETSGIPKSCARAAIGEFFLAHGYCTV